MVQLGRGDLERGDAEGAQLPGAADPERRAEEEQALRFDVPLQLRVEGDRLLQVAELPVQLDPARGQVHDARAGVEDLVRVHELELGAVGTRGGRRIDQLAGARHAAEVPGAQLRHDQARPALAEGAVPDGDHRF